MTAVIQRCMFIEGRGRLHLICDPETGYVEGALMDGPDNVPASMQAVDVAAGDAPGRILWSVRFREKRK